MSVKLIVAMDRERGIGKDNGLMWYLPADMKFFKETTAGQIVVMGRKCYDSIPERFRPLPNRENVVLTRNIGFKAEGCAVFHSLEDCLLYYERETVFIIGGGEIYRQVLDLKCVDEMYMTIVDAIYEADTFFPEFDQDKWITHEIFKWPQDAKNKVAFAIRHLILVR